MGAKKKSETFERCVRKAVPILLAAEEGKFLSKKDLGVLNYCFTSFVANGYLKKKTLATKRDKESLASLARDVLQKLESGPNPIRLSSVEVYRPDPPKEKKKSVGVPEPTYRQMYKAYMASDLWKNKRGELFLTKPRRCEKCGFDGMVDVHHLHYGNIGNENLEDLQILCRDCHETEHMLRPKWSFKNKETYESWLAAFKQGKLTIDDRLDLDSIFNK